MIGTVYIRNLKVGFFPTKLEHIMTQLTASLGTLNATLEATSATLDKVTDEYITTVADLTDKLAAALAAGSVVPPEIVAAVERAQAKADALKGKADALDALAPDTPAP